MIRSNCYIAPSRQFLLPTPADLDLGQGSRVVPKGAEAGTWQLSLGPLACPRRGIFVPPSSHVRMVYTQYERLFGLSKIGLVCGTSQLEPPRCRVRKVCSTTSEGALTHGLLMGCRVGLQAYAQSSAATWAIYNLVVVLSKLDTASKRMLPSESLRRLLGNMSLRKYG